MALINFEVFGLASVESLRIAFEWSAIKRLSPVTDSLVKGWEVVGGKLRGRRRRRKRKRARWLIR